ncbi:tumor necrosis factor receptor superfamily member 5-like isoform X2 [Silurus asotus]|uniref:Tumor necrosis factor receptor superfamily member 5-like isoform X2 n=1 Tax=Silurus asotus TaxID=30991 RepID=A0AAD5AQ03_SILAS|nr:tumor necrosis factor receptor superfamily member 5-like isoform X2 [Silurus asotus]
MTCSNDMYEHNNKCCDKCQKANSKRDTLCKPCPEGTFNNNTDYITPCRNHTSCLDLGRKLFFPGTTNSDAICGDFIPSCPKSYWMLPAGLWAGLILTLILFIIGFTCRKCKRKRKAGKDCAVEDDYALECDGISLNMFPEKCVAFSIPVDINMSLSEPYKSEPQEDDWPAL